MSVLDVKMINKIKTIKLTNTEYNEKNVDKI